MLRAPEGAPNVVIVLLDDMGFGMPSAFGGCVDMPTTGRLVKGGLRYNHMHTTAQCSPTRAALLTGRNHHAVNMGEFATSWPGATGMRPNTCATIGEILKLHGYNTGYFGKSHETPSWEQSISGPYNRWPTGSGLEKFDGFFGGEIDQFVPVLFDGTTRVDPPKSPEQGYHLSDDMTENAIAWIREQQTGTPDRPFFAYVAYGATHAPHQVPDSLSGEMVILQLTDLRVRSSGVLPEGLEYGIGSTCCSQKVNSGRTIYSRLVQIDPTHSHRAGVGAFKED